MLTKECIQELASHNLFLLKIKPDEAERNIKKLISNGEALLSRYQEYDRSILLTINFFPIESNGFSEDRTHMSKIGIDPLIYIFIDKESKEIEARVFENVERLPQKFHIQHIPVNEIPTDVIDQQTRIKIIKELSLHNQVSFSAFNFDPYKIWLADCMQLLDDIDYCGNKSWFPMERYDLGKNKDKDFLGLFLRQISSLKTRLVRYSSSKKISLKRLRLISYISNTTKSILSKVHEHFILSITTFLLGVLALYWGKIEPVISPHLPPVLKNWIN